MVPCNLLLWMAFCPLHANWPKGLLILGSVLCTFYIQPPSDIINMHGCSSHKYTDDTELAKVAFLTHFLCSSWHVLLMFFARMTCNKLYYWQSWSHVCWLMYFYILDSKFTDIERVEIPFQSSVKYLGVHLSQVLSMQCLISSICKADFLQVCKICKHICCKVLIAHVLLDLSLCIGYCMTTAAMFCRAYLLTLSCAWKELRIMLHASSFIYCAKLQH